MANAQSGAWQRARSQEQINERENAVLEAAERLFRTHAYEEVTLQRIAGEAGFTRSNVYRYFESREAIFLALHRQDIAAWVDDLSSVLQTVSPPLSAAEFIDIWTDVLMRQDRLLRLTPVLAISLEKNSSEELYREFKLFTRQTIAGAVQLLAPYLPDLKPANMTAFFFTHYALVAGGFPMCRYSEMQERVLETPELAALKLDFREFYRSGMLTYLAGLGAR